jgi:hypothetical protein
VTRSLAVVAAALGLILGSAPSAHAAIVNMDVDGSGSDYTGPGLLGTPGMTWNYQAAHANGTYGGTGFSDSTGSNSGVTMTLTGMAGRGTDLGGNAPTGFGALYTGYLYFNTASLVLNGLDQNLTYDVVFFSGFSNDNNGTLNRHYGAEITHGGTTLRSYGNLGTGRATTLSNGQNYVLFEDLSPTISGSLTFSMKTNTVADPNISGFVLGGVGVVNGFQLVAVPEPGTLALLGIVLGTVLLFRRKR